MNRLESELNIEAETKTHRNLRKNKVVLKQREVEALSESENVLGAIEHRENAK